MNLDTLNEQQKKAVLHKDGPMLVLAGAGSGKTKVLTNRIAKLIEDEVDPSSILAITFTNKAAKEMKDRVISLIGSVAYNIQISTFHSLGLKIIKENYEKLNYDKNFTIIDSDDALTIIKKIMKDMNMSSAYYNAREIRNKISSAKNELMDVDNFARLEYDHKVVEVYEKYLQKLKNNNSVDFDDLLILPIKLFKAYPNVLEYYQDRYHYLLIDEYQDTNMAQYTLSKMLSNKYKNIFVVGDNDQSIYAFRGANYKNILNFENDYPNCQVIMLEENYRSTKMILNAANSVIKHNRARKDKNLWCNNEQGEKITYIKTLDEKSEAKYIADEIMKLKNNGVMLDNIAILYRTNAQSRTLEEAMLKNNIPYKIIGSFYFYNRSEIKDLLCYLRLIANNKDDISLLRAINTPKRGIGQKTIENLTQKAIDKKISLFEAIESGKELIFKNLILDLKKQSENLSLTELVDLVLDKSGIRKELESSSDITSEIRLENLNEFKSITLNYENEYGIISLNDFLDEISLVSDMSEHQNGTNKVNLMTIHSVKGLEFDYVFVAGVEEGIFPHYNAINDGTNSAIEEERRLCYVAITRAKKKLWLLTAKRRMLFGNTQANLPSRFLEEIDPKYLEVIDEKPSLLDKLNTKIKVKIDTTIDYQVGDNVRHNEFGEGVVVMVDKSIITVAFAHPVGIRKIMKGHPSISKI